MRMKFLIVVIGLGAWIMSGCGNGDDATREISGPGTIRQFQVEGGGFELVAANGSTYLPENLPAQFQVDGDRVNFSGHLTGASTVQQVGPTIHIDLILAAP